MAAAACRAVDRPPNSFSHAAGRPQQPLGHACPCLRLVACSCQPASRCLQRAACGLQAPQPPLPRRPCPLVPPLASGAGSMASPGRSRRTREGIKARGQLASQSSHESLHGLLSTAASAPAVAWPGAGAQQHLPAGRLLLYGVLGAILLINVAWVWQEAAAGRWGGGRVFARSAVVKPSPLAFQVRSSMGCTKRCCAQLHACRPSRASLRTLPTALPTEQIRESTASRQYDQNVTMSASWTLLPTCIALALCRWERWSRTAWWLQSSRG